MPDPSAYWSTYQRRLTDLGCQPVLIGALAALAYRATPRFTTPSLTRHTSTAG